MVNAVPDFDAQVTFCYTSDLTATTRFYEDILGLGLSLDQGRCRIYRVAPGAHLGFCTASEARPTDGFIATDYTTDGAEVTYEFEVVTPGTYDVHFRTYSSGSGADSFYWGIDDVYVDQESTDTHGAWTW